MCRPADTTLSARNDRSLTKQADRSVMTLPLPNPVGADHVRRLQQDSEDGYGDVSGRAQREGYFSPYSCQPFDRLIEQLLGHLRVVLGPTCDCGACPRTGPPRPEYFSLSRSSVADVFFSDFSGFSIFSDFRKRSKAFLTLSVFRYLPFVRDPLGPERIAVGIESTRVPGVGGPLLLKQPECFRPKLVVDLRDVSQSPVLDRLRMIRPSFQSTSDTSRSAMSFWVMPQFSISRMYSFVRSEAAASSDLISSFVKTITTVGAGHG